MTLRAVLFDLDGTLIDSARAIAAAFRATLEAGLGRTASDEEILSHWSLPIAARFRAYSPSRADELADDYIRRYREVHDRLVRPFPGVVEVLAEVRARGYRCAIVTSKRRASARLAIDAFGLGAYVETVVADEDVAHHKPAPDVVLLAAERLGEAPSSCLVVGDSPLDVRAAAAAGARSAVAAWGAVDLDAALAAEPDHVLRRPADLLVILPPLTPDRGSPWSA